jgi:hypothetical protein
MGGPNIPVLVCAAFVLGGSSNLMLAGEAEDAARESCRYLMCFIDMLLMCFIDMLLMCFIDMLLMRLPIQGGG